MLFAIEYQLKKDVQHYSRSIYTFLDVLGDIGGLLDALKVVTQLVVLLYFSVFGNPMHEFLLKGVFMRESKYDKSSKVTYPATTD